jgi:hypothetical protein
VRTLGTTTHDALRLFSSFEGVLYVAATDRLFVANATGQGTVVCFDAPWDCDRWSVEGIPSSSSSSSSSAFASWSGSVVAAGETVLCFPGGEADNLRALAPGLVVVGHGDGASSALGVIVDVQGEPPRVLAPPLTPSSSSSSSSSSS